MKNFYDFIIIPSSETRTREGQFSNFDGKGMYLGGQARMDAVVKAYELFPSSTFVVAGGLDIKPEGETYSKAAEMADFLKEHRSEMNVEIINSLPCSRHNLIAVFNSLPKDVEKQIALISNEFHLPRLNAFWKSLQEEYNLPSPDLLAPKDFGIREDEIVDENSETYLARIRLEEAGVHSLEEGKYKDSCYEKLPEYRYILGENINSMLSKRERAYFLNETQLGINRK